MKAKEKVLTMDLREVLKDIMQKEIENLPETRRMDKWQYKLVPGRNKNRMDFFHC